MLRRKGIGGGSVLESRLLASFPESAARPPIRQTIPFAGIISSRDAAEFRKIVQLLGEFHAT